MTDQIKGMIEYNLRILGHSKGELADELGIVASALSHKLSGKNPWEQHELRIISEFLRLGEDDIHRLYSLAGFTEPKRSINQFDLEQVWRQIFEQAGFQSLNNTARALDDGVTDIIETVRGTASYAIQERIAEKALARLAKYLLPEQIEWLQYYIRWCTDENRQLGDEYWAARELLLKPDHRPYVEWANSEPDDLTSGILRQALNKEDGDQFLRERFPRILELYLKQQLNVSVAIIDIDELTIINKQYGTEVGDKILATVGEILYRLTKQGGFSGRCGDDTYYVVFSEVDISRATSLANDIRSIVTHFPWPSIAANLRVTCSVGVAEWTGKEDSRDVVVRASMGMLMAKKEGGNRTRRGPEYLSKQESRDLRRYFS